MDPQRKDIIDWSNFIDTMVSCLANRNLVWNRLDADRVILRQIWSPETGWSLGDGQLLSFMNSEQFQPLHLPLLVYLLASIPSITQMDSFSSLFSLQLNLNCRAGLIVNALLKEYTGRPRPQS